VNLDNVRNAEAVVQRAKGFFSAGTRAKIEVTRAESNLANAKVALIQAQNEESKARAAFALSLGMTDGPNYEPQESQLEAPTWSQSESISKAKDCHPSLKAAFTSLKAAEFRLRNAEAGYYPSLSTSFSYAWGETLFPPQPFNWRVGMDLSVPLINEPTASAAVQSAEAQRLRAEGTSEQLALQIQQQAAESWLDLQAARSRLEAANVALESNEENYRLASERYNVGVGDSLEVSDAQRLLVQARSQEVQARFDLQLAIARLYRQVGGLNLETLLPKPHS